MSSLLIVGPGRAGCSMALAARNAGHTLVGVVGRSGTHQASALLGCAPYTMNEILPPADICLVSVSDSAIESVAHSLVGQLAVDLVAHVSGATSIEVLAGLDLPHGSIHPLQSLPSPELGSVALVGAGAAITGSTSDVVAALTEFATSIGCRPFPLGDSEKAMYHAAASAASNFVTTVLGLSADLFREAGVDPAVAEPLTATSVHNAYALGARGALTGPVMRGDVETVETQMRSAVAASPELGATFAALVEATERLAEKDIDADR